MRVRSTASAKRPGSSRSPAQAASITPGVNSKRDRKQHNLARKQHREDAVGEQPRRVGSALLAHPRISRHESGIERAFGKNRAKMIGQPQRDEKSVGHRPRAEHAASMMSRRNPVTRETSVRPPTVRKPLITDALLD